MIVVHFTLNVIIKNALEFQLITQTDKELFYQSHYRCQLI